MRCTRSVAGPWGSRDAFESGGAEDDEAATAAFAQSADQLPHLVEMMEHVSHGDADDTLGWCDDQVEFEFALDLILDGLNRLREGSGS